MATKRKIAVTDTEPDELQLSADTELDCRRTLELVFYVHIEMAKFADRELARYKMGRAHHRVLYLTAHNPGIAVHDIMSVLRVSNQALSRTLSQLMNMDLIEQRPGKPDRRRRCHHCTPKGMQLIRRLTQMQFRQIEEVQRGLPRKHLESLWAALYHMVRDSDKPWISIYPPK